MRRSAISPSRARDFLQCPLMFRYRAVDRIPESPRPATAKGTLVHAVLERLYDLPAADRTEEAALGLLDPQWESLRSRQPEVLSLFDGPGELESWLAEARALVSAYFRVENPRRLEPAERERLVEVEVGGILLRGYIDRVDRAPNGATRIVDYKTGRSPSERFTSEALFQMRFYALMLWRLEGVAPKRLQLVYLGDGRTLTLDPDEDDLADFEASISALWSRIEAAARAGDFPARRSPLCPWCSFREMCPAFGGPVPALPAEGVSELLGVRRPATVGG